MTVHDLWLPIVLTGVATHLLCTLAWTVLPHHKPEWNRLPQENELMELLHNDNTPPNQYIFPFAADGTEAQSAEFKNKTAKCNGMLVLWPEPLQMATAIR